MFDPGIKQTEPMTVAFLAVKGPYGQIPQAMGQLYGTAAQMGIMPTGMPMAVYFTDPAEVPEAEALWELWAPLAGPHEPMPADESGFGIKDIGAETVAFALHKGPYETIDETYDRLGTWATSEGKRIVGPPREIYYSDPNTTPAEEYLTEVQFPIA